MIRVWYFYRPLPYISVESRPIKCLWIKISNLLIYYKGFFSKNILWFCQLLPKSAKLYNYQIESPCTPPKNEGDLALIANKLKSIISTHGYQLNSTANPVHLPQKWSYWLNWQCCLGGTSETAPRILIFSIVLGAGYSFYLKSIATYAPRAL